MTCHVVHHLRDDRREQRLIVILAPRTAMAAVTINAWNRSMVAFRITAAARNT